MCLHTHLVNRSTRTFVYIRVVCTGYIFIYVTEGVRMCVYTYVYIENTMFTYVCNTHKKYMCVCVYVWCTRKVSVCLCTCIIHGKYTDVCVYLEQKIRVYMYIRTVYTEIDIDTKRF